MTDLLRPETDVLVIGAGMYAAFEIGFEPGEPVTAGLRRLPVERDASLAFRYACLNPNACKECMMLLDDRVIYACTARLEAREIRLDPLPDKPLPRELATVIASSDERLA